ncbi:MAG TPA: ATP-binding protein [Rhodothermales bacterium]|nr:ATP-binding protein [Rhodothermales bacterium]
MRQVLIYFLFALCLAPLAARGQGVLRSEVGLPFYAAQFTPEQYHAHQQNWDVVQDARGFIYVANNQGILEYDGASWRLIPTATGTIVRALARDEKGTIYAGLQGDFGYLRPDADGKLRYVSLADRVDSAATDFNDIWYVHAAPEGVYFQARRWLFRWDGSKLEEWKAEHLFHTSFFVHGRFYVREHGRGLLEVVGDSLRLAPGGEFFLDLPIYVMLPLPEGRILIGTPSKGFFIYDQGQIEHFATEADPYLKQYRLYSGTTLSDGTFALATLGGGVLVMDGEGRLLRVYDESEGLTDPWVNAVYPDSQGGLWMALNTGGVVRVHTARQLSAFDESLGLTGTIYEIQRHEGTLYVATNAGLFALRSPRGSIENRLRPARFVRIDGIEAASALASAGSELLVGTGKGVYTLRSGVISKISQSNIFDIFSSGIHPGRVYAGTKDGLEILQRTPDGWQTHSVPGIGAEVRTVREDGRGNVWMATNEGGIVRLTFPTGRIDAPRIIRYSREDGLPGELMMPFNTSNGTRFASRSGIYRFSPGGEPGAPHPLFQIDPPLSPARSSEEALLAASMDVHNNIWLGYPNHIDLALPTPAGSYEVRQIDALRFPKPGLFAIYPESNGVVWLNDDDVLLRYDSRINVRYDVPFSAYVRRVSVIGTDSLVFGGVFARKETGLVAATQNSARLPVLNYAMNDLAIGFAAPSFNDAQKTVYQWYLEGKEDGWSDWSADTYAVYTNLSEGAYTFRVRARNAQGYLSSTGTFTFRILPPWFRTWWAYLIYAGIAVSFGVLALHYRRIIVENRKAQEQALQLAREREANIRLQEANERLEQADRIKDEFLTNTSHELRTPITAILGFSSVLKDEVSGDLHEFLDIIEENGKRLLHTVNSLLDLARLKAGAVDLHYEQVNVAEQAAEVIRLLSPLAQRKRLWLELDSPDRLICAVLDSQSFERILYNLIGNAIKFTEEGGITIRIGADDEAVSVQVIDTGIGIDAEFLPHLFEEFRQGSSGLSRSHEGSGLGLAITAKLVNLLGGAIGVESQRNAGSVFTITFPVTLKEEPQIDHAHFE